MTVETNDPRPASVQIADALRERIGRGELAQGAKLPSIAELAAEYGVAKMTAQSALQRLRDQRLVFASGRGYFVGQVAADDASTSTLVDRLRVVEAEVRELRSRVESLEASQ